MQQKSIFEDKGICPVLFYGVTGTGKSSSIGKIIDDDTNEVISLGLPPTKTLIINPEQQPLPISNFHEFHNIYVNSYKTMVTLLNLIIQVHETTDEDFVGKEDIVVEGLRLGDVRQLEFLVFDSLTSASEIIETYSRAKFSGWDVWTDYNTKITELLALMKQIPIQSFFSGIPETNKDDPNFKKFFKVKGTERRWGGIEKEFVVVLSTHPLYNDIGEAENILFQYKSNKFNTAKSPGRMFKKGMTNDLFHVANAIREFYNKPLYHDDRRTEENQVWIGI